MLIQVQTAGECLAVAVEADESIHSISHRATAKLKKLKPKLIPSTDTECECKEVRKTIGGSLLDPDDTAGNILKDGDFIFLVLKSELPSHHNDTTITCEHPILASYHSAEQSRKYSNYEMTGPNFGSNRRSQNEKTEILILDGNSMQPSDLVKCQRGLCIIQISPQAEVKISQSRSLLEKIVDENAVVYGVTTGFGIFSNTCIPKEKLFELQENLIRSHATGLGRALSPATCRALLALRINVLAKGYSGISLENVRKMVAAFNAFCVSYVPEQGTVGCSGDLCPLAHLALGLMGEGRMWSPTTGWDSAHRVLSAHNLTPMKLGPKEGIALINGTQLVTTLAAIGVERARSMARQADVIAALTLDVLKGTTRAYDPGVHEIRPHKGQMATARRLRSLLHSDTNPSQIAESHRYCNRVQDAYTLRCVPQVHGVVHDTVQFVRDILTVEMNSATDNPLVFAERREIISAGNFHGEYPAKMADYLAIAVHELAQISERRLERLVSPHLSGLPTFLTREGGLNSGFMTVQVCAASLVSENKALCHPASVDSIPTSCNQEDHVSMGGYAARKLLQVIDNVQAVLAMELLAACQGMEFLKPLMTTGPLQKVYNLVRSVSAPLERDRSLQTDIEAVIQLLADDRVWSAVQPHISSTRELEALYPSILHSGIESPTGSMSPSKQQKHQETTEILDKTVVMDESTEQRVLAKRAKIARD